MLIRSILLLTLLLLSIPSYAQLSGSSCLAANGGNSCTANDLQITGVTLNKIVDGCTNLTDTALVDLTAELTSGSSQRYDVGIWINEDGTSALTGGQCFRDWLPVADGYAEEEGNKADLCGTVTKSTSTTRDMFSVVISCADLDGDTLGEVSTCLSWKQTASNDCNSLSDAVPGSGSKCRCGETQLDALSIPDISLTKSCTPDAVTPGSTVACTITISNAAGAGTATGLHFEDDYPQTYGSVSSIMIDQGSVSDNGDILNIQTGDIAGGTDITLTYDFVVNDASNLPAGNAFDSFTNVVNTFYTNSDGAVVAQDLSASETTTVPITLSYVQARRQGNTLYVDWQTETETGNLGFNILAFDEQNNAYYRLNKQLIPSKVINSTSAVDYNFNTQFSIGETQIMVEDMDIHGNLERHGPYTINQSYGRKLVKKQRIDWQAIALNSPTKKQGRVEKLKKKRSKKATTPFLIEVTQTGIQRVYLSHLSQANIDTKHLSYNSMNLSDNGSTKPYFIGQDDNGTYIEFVADKANSLYTDSNYYVLTVGKKGTPAKILKAKKQSQTPQLSYTKQITATEPQVYHIGIAGAKPWYDDRLLAVRQAASKTYTIHTQDLATGEAGQAGLSVRLLGGIDFPEPEDHHVLIKINGHTVAESRFDGLKEEIFNMSFDHNLLNATQANTIEIISTAETPRQLDLVLIQDVTLRYPALLTEINDPVVATDVTSPFTTSSNLTAYASNEQELFKLIPKTNQDGSFTFPVDTEISDRHFMASSNNPNYPAVFLDQTQARANSSANHLVIAHPDFINEQLSNYLNKRADMVGGDYEIINVFDIYAEYSDHQVDALAIKEFVRQSSSFGQLKSVLLVGADSYDYKDYLKQGAYSFIPTQYMRTSTMVAQTPSDALIADINNDLIKDIAIGRLAVRTPLQLNNLITKTYQFWSQPNNKTALLIADKTDQQNDINFSQKVHQYSDYISDKGWYTSNIYLDGPDAVSPSLAREQVLNTLNFGHSNGRPVSVVLFNGHSSLNRWTFDGVFSAADAKTLQNESLPFVSVQWGCWNSYFVSPKMKSMAHNLLLSGTNGAVAVVGSSTLSKANDQTVFADIFHRYMIDKQLGLGEALVKAKQEFSLRYPNKLDVLLGINLLGDPILQTQ